MSMLRYLLIVSIFALNLHSIDVIVTTSKINYKEIIPKNKLSLNTVSKVKKHCIPVTVEDFKKEKYVAKRYIRKGTILCTKDIEKYSKSSVLFNFGAIEIERTGKIVFENDKYIKIKKDDGKIEKIYKDGRL